MKKGLLQILLFTFLSVLLLTTASAEETTHFIPEFDLDITIPSEYYTITQDTPADAPIFELIGKTKEEITKISEANHIYFDAVIPDTKEEICVTIIEGNHDDINTDTGLKDWTSNLYNLFDSKGHKISYYEVYQHPQTRFLKIFLTESTGDHCLMYLTVRDGTEFLFTFSAKQPLTHIQEEQMETVVNSIVFEASINRQKPLETTNPVIYTDADSGTTFTVPENRIQKPLFVGQDILDSKFVSTDGSGGTIIYQSTDIWEGLTVEEKTITRRSDINNTYYTREWIAETLGIEHDEVSIVTYNDIPYYHIVLDYTDLLNLDIDGVMTELIHIENGWMYVFQFDGTYEDKGFSDFEVLINSVEYPVAVEPSNNVVTQIPDQAPDANEEVDVREQLEDDSGNRLLIVSIFLIILAGIGLCCILAYLENRKKNRVCRKKIVFICETCGHQVPKDSLFCPYCGVKTEEKGSV